MVGGRREWCNHEEDHQEMETEEEILMREKRCSQRVDWPKSRFVDYIHAAVAEGKNIGERDANENIYIPIFHSVIR